MTARDPVSFLDAVAGYAAERNRPGSADRPIKLATVDPAYVASSYPATLPKVTFDGESTLSGKRYPVLSGYLPRASDRVVMLPAGNTYVILGSLDADTVGFDGGGVYQSDDWMWQDTDTGNDTTSSTTYVAGGTVVGTAFVAPQSGNVLVHLQGGIGHNSTTISQSAYLSFEVRAGGTVGSGSVFLAASDANGGRVLNPSTDAGFKYGTAVREIPVTGLTPGSTYNARLMFRTTIATGTYLQRHILIKQAPGPLG